MKYIVNESNNPYYNLALEEYVFKNLKGEYILLWINSPSIIVGRFQNIVEEVSIPYARANNIDIIRRVTGGGTVYHDLGNLNFSFITEPDSIENIDLKAHNLVIVRALSKIGVKCELNSRNDIIIEGKKISGSAQSINHNRVLNHGTLLFDSQLEMLNNALSVKRGKIESKGIKSVSNSVINIKPFLNEDIDILTFKKLLLEGIYSSLNLEASEYKLNSDDIKNIESIAESKYRTWEWNFSNSPKFIYCGHKINSDSSFEIRLQVEKGIIIECKFYGDFIDICDLRVLGDTIEGLRYDLDEVKNALSVIKVNEFLRNTTNEDLLECMFN
ncbi:MAG: lipoate--protein ligase [Youngiibacter sp.]|nr:lipoate--protein ligase [Youngiibacter sp.]